MTYNQIERKYIDELIPSALDSALKAEKKAELFIYRVLTDTLTNLVTSSIILEPTDPVCRFYEKYKEEGLIGMNALDYIKEQGKKPLLRCQFDMAKIAEDINTLATELYGSLPTNMADTVRINSKDIEASPEDIAQLSRPMQKQITMPKPAPVPKS